jgi:hypothetical protein
MVAAAALQNCSGYQRSLTSTLLMMLLPCHDLLTITTGSNHRTRPLHSDRSSADRNHRKHRSNRRRCRCHTQRPHAGSRDSNKQPDLRSEDGCGTGSARSRLRKEAVVDSG